MVSAYGLGGAVQLRWMGCMPRRCSTKGSPRRVLFIDRLSQPTSWRSRDLDDLVQEFESSRRLGAIADDADCGAAGGLESVRT